MNTVPVYNPFPIEVERAEGVYIFAKNGEKYLDTFAGIGVSCFGHSYQPLLHAMKRKMDRYVHLSSFLLDEDVEPVAGLLIEYTGRKGKVFFSNSGTEAMEAVLKALKKIATAERNKLVYFSGGFHGRTIGALSINGIKKIREPFLPLLPNTVELPFNDVTAFENFIAQNGSSTLAVTLEALQGSGGVVPVSEAFARAITAGQKQYGYKVVCDEIQAGLGRAGKYYCYQHFPLEPNMLTVGKALGGGLPLGAAIYFDDCADIFKAGEHGSTFAPNPVALAGGRYVLEYLPNMLDGVNIKGELLKESLRKLNNPKIKEIRGLGLMIGVQLDGEYPQLRDAAFQKENLLLNVVGNKIVRFLPPFNTSNDEIILMVEKLGRVL